MLGKSQVQGEVLSWLATTGRVVCQWSDDAERFVPVAEGLERILADYHGIDLDRIAAEKRRMVVDMRTDG